MIRVLLNRNSEKPLDVLCIGAHSDDIEIGCGGSVLRLKQMFPDVRFTWIVFSACGERRDEANKSAELFTAGRDRRIALYDFRDGYLPHTAGEVKDVFEQLKKEIAPDLIFTHWNGDAHQDHRLLNELTWNTFRNHMILEYEIPKYDGDLGRPGVFLELDQAVCEEKLGYVFECFKSQIGKHWFDRDTFLGLMRLRGMESCAGSRHAEAFYCRKLVI
jgi:LmbE family N-acetylglucosaminyl deacetylase